MAPGAAGRPSRLPAVWSRKRFGSSAMSSTTCGKRPSTSGFRRQRSSARLCENDMAWSSKAPVAPPDGAPLNRRREG